MMPNLIDLTLSDDDSPSNDPLTRRGSHLPPGSGKRSASSYLKRATQPEEINESLERRNGPVEQANRYAPSKNHQSANHQSSLNDSSQQSTRANVSHTQSTQNRRARENGTSSFHSSRSANQSSKKGEQDITDLTDDEVPRRQFRLPQGMEHHDSFKSPNQNTSLGSPFDGSSVLGRKRALERDSPLNVLSPSKRVKTARKDGETESASNSQSESRRSAKGSRESTKNLANRSVPKSRPSNLPYDVDLTSPPMERIQRMPQNVREGLDVHSSQKTRPTSLADIVNGRNATSKSPVKRPKDRDLASDSEDFSKSARNDKQDRFPRSSPKLSNSTTQPDTLAFREQRSPGRRGATPSNGVVSPRDSRGTPTQEQDKDVTTSRKTSIFKTHSPAINNAQRDRIASPSHNSVVGSSKITPETSEKGTNSRSKDRDSQKLRKRIEHGSSVASNDLEKTITSNGSIPKSGTVARRKVSAEEDQGYASPSPGNRQHSTRRPRKDSESESRPDNEIQPNSISTASKSNDALNKTLRDDHKTDTQKRKNKNESRVSAGKYGIRDEYGSEAHHPAQSQPQASISTGLKSVDSQAGAENGVPAAERPQVAELGQMTTRQISALEKALSRSAHSFSEIRKTQDAPVNSVGRKLKRSMDDEVGNANTELHELELADRSTNDDITEAEEADFQLRSEAMQGAVEKHMDRDAQGEFVAPTISASALKDSSMYPNMTLANRVERVLGKYFEELRGDTEYWTSVSMRRARLTKDEELHEVFSEPSNPNAEEITSFGHFQPLKLSLHKKGSSSTKSDDNTWGIQKMGTDGKTQPQVEMSAPYMTFSTDQQDVPNYAHYVSIKNNILAPNVIHLHCWPYFGDDFDTNKAHNLHDQYKIDIRERERKLLLLLKAQKYEEYVESALHELECSWSDVLRFLLEVKPDVGLKPAAQKALDNRQLSCQEDFSRGSNKWQAVLHSLPPSDPDKLGCVAIICETFQKMAKFSLWHIARKSDFANSPEEADMSAAAQPPDNELTCRICLRFNCPYHGYFKHRADDTGSESDEESVSSVDDVVATDIIHPFKANYRSRVAFPPDPPAVSLYSEPAPIKRRKRDQNYWSGYRHKAEDRGPFYPCHHPDTSCEDANCRCFVKGVPCEKSCSCSPDCARKFKGCSCGSKKGHRLVCFEDADCVCWQLGRECDPDLCGNCGVCDIVDPVNKYNDGILTGRCRNASIQRGVPKHTLLGDSGVHGLGLYACENIRQNDFVGEYKGEIIAKREADRRGAVYEHQKLSYLFSLNKAQEIDSTYFGNKVRFINHAHGEKANLYPRIIMVNTVHRIALYAGKDIHAGKELLFDYGPYFPNEQLQGKKSKKSAPESKKSAPHVRNANLVREFYDVEESEDEDGILRAKAVSHSAAGTKGRAKNKKPRGGARSGAGRKPNVPRAAQQEPLQESHADDLDKGPDAGVRLAAFNISDDLPSEAMDLDADGAAEEDDEEFSPEGSESDDSEESDSERSELDDDDEELEHPRRYTQRGVVRTRYGRR